MAASSHFVRFIVLADEFDPNLGDAALVVEFSVDGINPIAVTGGYDETETGMAEVVVELLAGGILAVAEDVAEFIPALADGFGWLVPVQDVAGIADPAEAGVDADLADAFRDVDIGFHG